jgi:DNA-binding transcriptional MerR regulator
MADANPGDVFLQIGEAAERLGLTQRTLRFYEEKGLLEPPTRMDGGFRLYSPDDLQRLDRIKQLKDLLGFCLADIKEMLDAEEIRLQMHAEWRKDANAGEKAARIRKAREMTLQQMALIDHKVASMDTMRQDLASRLDKYDSWLREHAAQLDGTAAAATSA